MYWFGMILVVIQATITWYIMITIMDILSNIPSPSIKLLVFKLFTARPISFVINLAVSSMMAWFTGAGLYAGFANLGSSVVVGIIFPVYFKMRYDMQQMEKDVNVPRFLRKRA